MSHFFTKPKRDQLTGLETIDETTLSSAAAGDVIVAKDDSGTIRFVNVVSTAADAAALPSASDYPGKTCVAQDTGKLHYSDGTEWKALGLDGEVDSGLPAATGTDMFISSVDNGSGAFVWEQVAAPAIPSSLSDLVTVPADSNEYMITWNGDTDTWAMSGFSIPGADTVGKVLVGFESVDVDGDGIETVTGYYWGYTDMPSGSSSYVPDGSSDGDMLVWQEAGAIVSGPTISTPAEKLIRFEHLGDYFWRTGTVHLTLDEDRNVASLEQPQYILSLATPLALTAPYNDVRIHSDGNIEISDDEGVSWEEYPSADFELWESSDATLPASDGWGFMGELDFVSVPTSMGAGSGSGSLISWNFDDAPSGYWSAQAVSTPTTSNLYAAEASEWNVLTSGALGIADGDGNDTVTTSLDLSAGDNVWYIINAWGFGDDLSRELTIEIPYAGVTERRQLFIVNRETSEDPRTVYISVGKDDGTDDSTLQGISQTMELEPGATARLVCVATGAQDAHWILA